MVSRVKAKIVKGAIKEEKVAYIKDVSGEVVEVIVGSSQAGKDDVEVGEVGRDEDKVLIELPRESTRGYWRMWVNRKQLVGGRK